MTLLFVLCALTLTLALFAHAAEPSGGDRKPNALIHETSPYLLQHAYNPVHWNAWGPAAFEKAKRENKPIFLSVGYSTCHWCHVMERESFEDDEVAAVINEYFVPIKVDREERPDVDEQYMLATQLYTQRGGWPNSVWLTPDGRPWYAGTYFRREQFIQLLKGLHEAWTTNHAQVEEQANRFAAAIRQVGSGAHIKPGRPLSPKTIEQALDYFRGNYDENRGGFGSAPKFPPHGSLALFIHQQQATADLAMLSMITHTLDAMSAGGIYDHVGGGFHRYSTDARWFLPHFEKMLYDNAQLMRSYADGYAMTKSENYKRIIAETFAWLSREMTDAQGGFYSALDADSEGEEGKFYVWKMSELTEVLGDRAAAFAQTYNATDMGNYFEEATRHRTGANILYLEKPSEQDAWAGERAKLLAVRDRRVHPHLDDKVLSGWNGLMITGLAHAGATLKHKPYLDAAEKAADFVLSKMTSGGRLLRSWRKGEAKLPGYLDDYAFVIEGLLELHQATGNTRWLDAAKKLTEIAFSDFYDFRGGGFYMTSSAHDELLLRAKELGGGGNIPSGNGVMVRVLTRLALLTGEARYADAAGQTLAHFAPSITGSPFGSETLLLALAEFYDAQRAKPDLFKPLPAPKSSAGDAVATEGPVTVEAYASALKLAPGETFRLALRLRFEGNYHLYANQLKQTNLIPTTIALERPSLFTLGEVTYPKPTQLRDPVLNEHIDVYGDLATIVAEIKTPGTPGSAGTHNLVIKLRGQACNDEQCLAPQNYTLTIPITLDPTAEPQSRHPEIFK